MNPARTEIERARERCKRRDLDWREELKADAALRGIYEMLGPLGFEKLRGEIMLNRIKRKFA